MKTNLSNKELSMIEEARFIADRSLRPRAGHHDLNAIFPADNMADLHAAGLTALLISPEFGGAGASLEAYVKVVTELAKACGSTALVFAMHCGATRVLSESGAARASAVIKKVIDNGDIVSWGFSEPGIGGNVLAPQLTAILNNDDELLIKGTKAFCTGAGYTDHYLINASSGNADFRSSQTMVILDAEHPGLQVEYVWDAMGMRANQANTIKFDLATSSDDALGGIGAGMPLLAHALPALVLGLAAASLGIAEAAHEFAIQHVNRRKHTDKGHALSGYPTVRAQIANAVAELHGARLAILEAARAAEQDPLDSLPAMNLAKYMANTAAIKVVDISMEVCGGRGFLKNAPLERYYRDARAGAVMGTNLGALRDLIGKFALGMDIR